MNNSFTVAFVKVLFVTFFTIITSASMEAQSKKTSSLHVIGYPQVVQPMNQNVKAEEEAPVIVNQGKGLVAQIADLEQELAATKIDDANYTRISQNIISKKREFISDKSSQNFHSLQEEDRDVYMKFVKELDTPLYQKIMKENYGE
ncbi:MAG: hypothetical protein Q8M29_06800 [Bacteroidota bacterium]|nr:hypothetical protein [Bacteroidota bacterium]